MKKAAKKKIGLIALVLLAAIAGGYIAYDEFLKPRLAETGVYVTVYSDSTLLSGVEVNLDSVENASYWVGAFTNGEGVATFSEIEIGNYYLFAKINGVWKKGATEIEVTTGTNYFTFRYHPSTNTWEVN